MLASTFWLGLVSMITECPGECALSPVIVALACTRIRKASMKLDHVFYLEELIATTRLLGSLYLRGAPGDFLRVV